MKYKGQSLVVLLVFAAITITITSAAASMIIANSSVSSKIEIGEQAYNIAESGMENALMRILRDPSYTGETLTVGDGIATIVVTGSNPYTIISTGSTTGFSRRIQVVVQFNSGVMTIVSWQEIYQ